MRRGKWWRQQAMIDAGLAAGKSIALASLAGTVIVWQDDQSFVHVQFNADELPARSEATLLSVDES